jgi:hypothetical protein
LSVSTNLLSQDAISRCLSHKSHQDDCTVSSTPLEPRYFQEYGSKRVKITYGPFTIPRASVNDGIQAFTIGPAWKPCDDCLITTFQGGLEFPDGSYANLNSSVMLNRMFTINKARNETVCSQNSERFFASGNERLAIDLGGQGYVINIPFTHWLCCSRLPARLGKPFFTLQLKWPLLIRIVSRHVKAGYHLSTETMSIQTELINLGDVDKDVYISTDWEYIPENYTEFTRLRPIWLDGSGICGTGKPRF